MSVDETMKVDLKSVGDRIVVNPRGKPTGSHHPLCKPLRDAAAVKRKICDSGAFHAVIVQSRRKTKKARW